MPQILSFAQSFFDEAPPQMRRNEHLNLKEGLRLLSHRRHQGKNRKVLCHHLQGHQDSFINPGPVTEEAKGELPSSQCQGPKKVEPFDPAVFETEIKSLDHGKKRSGGVANLYGNYQDHISRRDLF